MSVYLMDIVERDARYAIMVTDSMAGLIDVVSEFGIEQEIDFHMGITFFHVIEQESHCRAESIEIAFLPSTILILSYLLASPTVVGGTEDEDDVGIAEMVHSGEKRTVGIVVAIVTTVTDGTATIGVVDAEAVTALVGHLPPPSLGDIIDIGAVSRLLIIPHLVG